MCLIIMLWKECISIKSRREVGGKSEGSLKESEESLRKVGSRSQWSEVRYQITDDRCNGELISPFRARVYTQIDCCFLRLWI